MAVFTRLTNRGQILTWAGRLVRQLNRAVPSVVTGEVTLTASAMQTTVTNSGVSDGAFVHLMPVTASAATVGNSIYVVRDSVRQGTFTISHAARMDTDRTFTYTVFENKNAD